MVPDIARALLVLALLLAASLGTLFLHGKMPERHRQDDTLQIVRVLASNFMVMSALVLGLLMTSARVGFEAVDRGVHTFATELLLFDDALEQLGPEAAPVRRLLVDYVRRALDRTWGEGAVVVEDPGAGAILRQAGAALRALRPEEGARLDDWREAMRSWRDVVRERWFLVEEPGTGVPRSLLRIVVGWLILIFASFGYRAPRNAVVIASFAAGAFLLAAAVYLIADLSAPFHGLIRVSPEPLRNVLAHLMAAT